MSDGNEGQKKKRGRPAGMKMSEESKQKARDTRAKNKALKEQNNPS